MKVLTYTPSAARHLSRLPKAARLAIMEKIGRYAATGAGDVRALSGRPGARLRVGDYRVVFTETDAAIQVLALGHRRDTYE